MTATGAAPSSIPSALDRFLPDIDGEACLLAVSAASHCDACATACPVDALQTGDNGLNFDEGACTGCGYCIPACPEGAIASPFKPHLRDIQGKRAVFIACQHAETDAGDDNTVPCLDALGLRELTAIQRKGADRIIILSCDTCSGASGGELFRQRLALAQAMFASRNEPFPDVVTASPDNWRALMHKSKPCNPGRVLDRRGLFSMFTPKAEKKAEAPRRAAFGFPHKGPDDLAAIVPLIDPARCCGCNACIRICPHGALTREATVTAEYVINPALCTGCRLCIDICEDAAVSLSGPSQATLQRIPLQGVRCTTCGVQFYRPQLQQDSGQLCRICAKIGSTKKLFFVHSQE